MKLQHIRERFNRLVKLKPETMIEKSVFREAISAWGIHSQMDMLTEEVGELLQAMNKYKRSTAAGVHRSQQTEEEALLQFAQEITDVEIMLSQMKVYFKLEERVRVYRKEKVFRLVKRLSKFYLKIIEEKQKAMPSKVKNSHFGNYPGTITESKYALCENCLQGKVNECTGFVFIGGGASSLPCSNVKLS